MKILFVTPYFLQKGKTGTGMLIYTYRMAKALLALGHNPIIVCGGNCCKHEKFDGIDVYRVANTINKTNLQLIDQLLECTIGNYLIQQKVNEICKNQEIDIIQYAGNNGGGLFHKGKTPAVMRLSSYYKVTFATNLQYSKLQIAIHSYIERMAGKKMDGLYCPSKNLSEAFSKDIKRKVHVIEPPFFNEEERTDSKIYEKYFQDKKYILYYGTIWPEKGVLLLADIAVELLNKHPELYIAFIGDNCNFQGRSTLEEIRKKTQKVSEHIIYMKALPHSQLYPIIQKSELVILPSYMENISNACLESMYFGKIVVGTNGASFEQLIENGVNGYLFEQGNSKDLLRSINIALSLSPKEKDVMEQSARERIDVLKPENAVKRTLAFYHYIMNKKSKQSLTNNWRTLFMKSKHMGKNIAILIPGLFGGGAERVASVLSQYFYEKGYKIYIFTDKPFDRKRDYKFCGTVIPLNISVTFCSNTYLNNIIQLYTLLRKAHLVRTLKKKFHIDYSISFMEEYNLINILSRYNDKVIIRVCTILSERKEEFKENLYYNHLLLRLLYNKANHIIVMTQYAKKDLYANYEISKRKINIIPNPLFLNQSEKKAEEIRKEWKYGYNTIISVARLEKIKQQQHIIRAFSELLKTHIEATLIFVGNDKTEYAKYLKKLVREYGIEKNIFFTGRQKDVSFFLQNSKIFIMTSKTEGFPNSMIEAMEMGLPVISADCPGAPREILAPEYNQKAIQHIEYGSYGILVKNMDGNEYHSKTPLTKAEKYLAEAMERLLSDDKLYDYYKNAGKQKVKEYNSETIGKFWESIMKG